MEVAIRRGLVGDVTLVLYNGPYSILSEFKTMKSKKDVHPTNSLQHPLRRRRKGALRVFFKFCVLSFMHLYLGYLYVFGEIPLADFGRS